MPVRTARISLMVLALALLILFHRLLLGEVFYWGLPTLQFVPWRWHAIELLRAGELPLWNVYNGAGAPLLANYQSALLYPPNWLTLILPDAPTVAWGMSVIAVLHLFVTGWGMARLLARLGVPALGQGVGTLGFALGGYLVARLETYPIISAVAWLPWMVWAIVGFIRTGKPRDSALLATFSALLLLAGHAQVAWYTLLLAGVFALWTAWTSSLARRQAIIRLLGTGGCLLLGVGVAAIQLVPTAELLSQSQRGDGVGYDFAMNFSYAPLRAFNLLSANIFGTPADGSYYTNGAYFEDALYVGLLPLLAAFAALLMWRGRRRARDPLTRLVPVALLVVIVGFVFALGRYTPIFPFLYQYVPTFDLFQAPVRWHLWTAFGLSMLAAVGVTWWMASARARRWTRRLLAAFIGLVLVGIVGLLTQNTGNEIVLTALRAVLFAGVIGAGAALVILRLLRTSTRERWTTGLYALLAADLLIAGWGLNPAEGADFFVPMVATNAARAYVPADEVQLLTYDTYFRFDDYPLAQSQIDLIRDSRLPNLNLIDHAPLLNNFDPLLISDYAAYLHLIEATNNPSRLLQAAGVGERAWLVSAACWHETDAQLDARLLDPAWLPTQQVQFRGDGGCAPPEAPVGSIAYASEDGSEFRVSSPRDTWLVAAFTDYPGWTATVDGDAVPIYRANRAFRAVQVPPGNHEITFEYRPAWLLPSALISLISLLVLIVLYRLRSANRLQ